MRWVLFWLLPLPALADAVVPTRVIKAGQVIQSADLSVVEAEIPGTLTDPTLIIGQEARTVLYPGRPIRDGQVGPPALVLRNEIVTLTYVSGGLAIFTEGRALDRAGVGDLVPVLNLSSRTTVHGRVLPDGSVRVGPTEG